MLSSFDVALLQWSVRIGTSSYWSIIPTIFDVCIYHRENMVLKCEISFILESPYWA